MSKWKKPRYPQKKWICRGLGLLAAALLLLDYYKRGVPFRIGLGLLVVTMLVCVFALRCPHCGAMLGDPFFIKLEKCPRCGKDLS